jgi:LL-diaminopimelate aminotransferase
MPTPAARLTNLPVYAFATIGARIAQMQAQGISVLRLDMGSPDMPPQSGVIETLATSAMQPHVHGYAGYRGTPNFRAAVATYYQRRFEIELDPNREILPLLGSKEGIVNLALAYVDVGDLVLVPTIGYPSYSMGTFLANAEVYWLPVDEESGFVPDLASIPDEVLRRAKILWVNYPNNPTGATVELDFYQRAVDLCNEHNILLASDNPYVDVTFDGYRAPSALQARGARGCTIEFTSLSKTHNMAGWRLGAAAGNAEAVATLLQVKSNVDSGHFTPMYDAGAMALEQTTQAWIDERNAVYQRRRDAILAALPEIGLRAQTPRGSLYIWAKPEGMTGAGYCQQALEGAHVSLTPGDVYGPGGVDYVRIAITERDEDIDEALARLKAWWKRR